MRKSDFIKTKFKMMLKPEELIINRIAQDKVTLSEGLQWFDSLTLENRKSVLSLIQKFFEQSLTKDSEIDNKTIEKAISLIPLKPTMTPIVLLKTYNIKDALSKIASLPNQENQNAFLTLITLFKFSDSMRRTMICKNKCTHEWHNLDN